MITREIITDDFIWYEEDVSYTKIELCNLIDRWKYILAIKYQAKSKQTIALAFPNVTFNYLAVLFAAAELGMQFIILDYPLSAKTIHKTKAAFFAPIDFAVETEILKSKPDHHLMISSYCKQIIDESEVSNSFDTFTEIWCKDADILLCASTSGSTGDPKPVMFSHHELEQLSMRNAKVFKFELDSVVGHTKNMHHASSLITVMLPSLMKSSRHVSCAMGGQFSDTDTYLLLIEKVNTHGIDRMQFINYYSIKGFVDCLSSHSMSLNKPLLINISGFTVPEEFYNFATLHNVQFISHFGSVDTGIPLLVNYVNSDSTYEDKLLGVCPDDYYTLEIDVDGTCTVNCPFWDSTRSLSDRLNISEGMYYHAGRTEGSRIESIIRNILDCDINVYYVNSTIFLIVWDNDKVVSPEVTKLVDKILYLNKLDFTLETKVNVTQLKGYLECQ